MKDFSVNNIIVTGQAPVLEGNIGTAPNQIPLNKDLGSLAYQDAVNLDDVSADMLELRAIAAEISDSAVDVFVYDTSRDSDGGAWRKRTQHTSWYNEELNTATRGARREFPAVAVIVAEADKVTIYDGDDPDLPMWMIINDPDDNRVLSWTTSGAYDNVTGLSSLNGLLCVGKSVSSVILFDFIKDDIRLTYYELNYYLTSGRLITDRNNVVTSATGGDGINIVNNQVNDVAMTILPNAPIDDDTGLPVPTIAVATDGGVSVIKDDGTVVDIICSNTSFVYSYHVIFDQSNRLFLSIDGQGNSRRIWGLNNIPTADLVITTDINEKQNGDIFIADDNGFGSGKDMFLFNESNPQATALTSDNSIGTNKNLFKTYINQEDSTKSLYNYTTSKYNTGWMPGDIKLATLSDTTVEKIGVNSNNLLTGDNSTFDNGTGNWVSDSGAVLTHDTPGGYLQVGNGGGDNTFACRQYISFDTSKNYIITARVRPTFTGSYKFRVRIGANEPYATTSALTSGQWTEISTTVFSAEPNWLELGSDAGNITTFDIDDITIRETTELITNGDFSNGTTGWIGISDPTLTLVDDGVNLKVSSGDNQAGFHQNINANNIDQEYILSFEASDFTGDSDANLMLSINDYKEEGSAITGTVEMLSTKEDGFYSVSFNGRSGGVMAFFRIYDLNGTCSVDTHMNIKNISVRPAEEDRSVNDNGLQIVGEIDKTPVAPGADLVAYSGFNTNNYLVQPYNEDLDFTDTMSIMLWVKDVTGNFNPIDRGTRYIDHSYGLYLKDYAGGDIRFYYSVDGATDQRVEISGGNSLIQSGWHHVAVCASSGKIKMYVDGKLLTTADQVGDFYSQSTNKNGLKVGVGSVNSLYDHPIALLRISATAPTDAQIAKIYRDEKVLFQDGAQATLYGSSDAVTALSYDEKTELLHVGTSSGRSDFSGLRRIKNTTTAITTSISSHNNLIAEQ